MKTPRVVVLGSVNMDLVVRCARLPRPGETITASEFREIPGGKGANQAVAAARLGADVAMIRRVGNDGFAIRLWEGLENDGVHMASLRRTRDCPSGVAIVTVEESGENSITVVPGANARLSEQDVHDSRQAIADADVLLMQLEVPLATVLAAMHVARQAGVRVILDPAPAPATFPAKLLEADVICPNQIEAAALLGRGQVSVDDAQDAARELVRLGAKNAIVTLGEHGAVVCQSDGHCVHLPPLSVQAVDATAAGDAFAAALAVQWCVQDSLLSAARYACAAGAIAATRHGAQPAMPTRSEIEKLLRGSPAG